MIGKISVGKSFRGCLFYCLNDKRKQHPDEVIFKNRAEIIAFNQCNGTAQELLRQFILDVSCNVGSNLLKLSISFCRADVVKKITCVKITIVKNFSMNSFKVPIKATINYISVLRLFSRLQLSMIITSFD